MKLEHRTLLIKGCDNFEFVTESIRRPRASDQRVGSAVSAGNPWREEYTSYRTLCLLQLKTESARWRIYEHNLPEFHRRPSGSRHRDSSHARLQPCSRQSDRGGARE